MVRKFRVALALQPVATALFANSPFSEGRPNGFMSYRSHIWTDTDPDRTGMLDFVFEDGFGFERYADWLLDVPMYFVERDGRSLDAAGQSFRDPRRPPAGLLTNCPRSMGQTTPPRFPEVRLKRYMEMRGADAGPGTSCALPPSGPACSTTMPLWTPPGTWCATSAARNDSSCAAGTAHGAENAVPQGHGQRPGPAGPGHRRPGPGATRHPQPPRCRRAHLPGAAAGIHRRRDLPGRGQARAVPGALEWRHRPPVSRVRLLSPLPAAGRDPVKLAA